MISMHVPVSALPIARRGTPYVESLTSYLCGLARANRLSTTQLLRRLFRSRYSGDVVDWRRIKMCTVGSANGYGVLQQRFLQALSQVATYADLQETCLASLRVSFAAGGRGVVKMTRFWCGPCYFDASRKGDRASDMLAWYFADLQVCPLHLVPLSTCCSRCKAQQPWIPTSGALDICSACGAWLGSEIGAADCELGRKSAYQTWLAKNIQDLLGCRSESCAQLKGDECYLFFKAAWETRGGSVSQFGRTMGVGVNTTFTWLIHKKPPSLVLWMRVCARLNVSPALALLAPEQAGSQRELGIDAPAFATPRVLRARPTTYDAATIRAAVRAQLDSSSRSVGSVKELAYRLGVPNNILYYYAGRDVKRLRALLYKEKKRSSIRTAILRAAGKVVRRQIQRSGYLTPSSVAKEVSRQIGCNVSYARGLAVTVIRAELSRQVRHAPEYSLDQIVRA